MSPAHLSLGLGLLLGATATWLATRPSSASSTADNNITPADPITLPSWSWRASATPAPLAADTASAAIAAWLDLRAPDGAPAAFAARADSLRALLARLPAADFPRLLTPLAALTTPEDRRLLQGAFEIWVEHDPAAAARWAGDLPESPGLDHLGLAHRAAREWAKIDTLAAATWACSLPDDARARSLARGLLPILAEKDSARALALATARGEEFLDAILSALMEPLAKTDPGAALRAYGPRLWKNGDGFWPLRETFAAWVTHEPSAAVAWLLAQPRRNDDELSNWLGNLGMGEANQAALATALASVPDLPGRQSIIGRILFSWGADKPEEALAWLNSLSDRHLRTVLLERAARITYSNHPERSLPLALAMSEGENRTQRLSDLLGEWAKNDPSAALAWIREHDDPGVAAASTRAHASVLAAIARDEPETALAEWNALPDGATKSAALTPIAEAWSRTDPGAALQWLTEQETARAIRTRHDALVYSWAQKDPLAALRWAEEQTQGDMRQGYLRALAGDWRVKAPRAATADLYLKIQDKALRTETLTAHVTEWLTKDPAAARSWLESNDALTPAQAAALLTPVK